MSVGYTVMIHSPRPISVGGSPWEGPTRDHWARAWKMDKPAEKQTDFDAKGNHAPMFDVPGILKKFKKTGRSPKARLLGRSWSPECSNCGERMEELPDSPKRAKNEMLFSGWFSEHCGSYFFLCES